MFNNVGSLSQVLSFKIMHLRECFTNNSVVNGSQFYKVSAIYPIFHGLLYKPESQCQKDTRSPWEQSLGQ